MPKISIPLPSNGLMVDRPAEYIDNRSVPNIKNMETNRGIIRKRIGTVDLGTSLGERVMRYFELQVGGATRLFRVGLTKIQVLNKTTGAWASVATTPLTGSVSDIINIAFPLLSGAKIAVITNGIDVIQKISITGNTSALGGSPPKCKFIQAFGPYLVLGYITDGGNTYYSRVQWCDTGNPEMWDPTGTNAGSQDLLDDPEDMSGFGILSSYLTVHKPNSIYLGQLTSTTDIFRFDRRATGVGAIAGATIQQIPTGQQIFLGNEGLHLFDGNTCPLIDSPIQDELRERMNPLNVYKSHSLIVRELDEYWVAIPLDDATEPSTVYKYNWRSGQIYKDSRVKLTAMGTYLNIGGDFTWDSMAESWNSATLRWSNELSSVLLPHIIFGDSTGVTSNRTTATYDDAGSPNEAVWETKDFVCEDFGIADIDTIMRWKGLQVWAKGDGFNAYYSIDSGSTWVLIGNYTLTADYPIDSTPLCIDFDVVSSNIRLRFTNSSSEECFTIKKYQIDATPREKRK